MKQTDHTMSPRAQLKLRARTHMGKAFAACATLGAAVVVMALALEWVYMHSGGVINLYYWAAGSSDIQSSFSLTREGLFAALRLEEAGIGFSVAVTPKLFWTFLLVRALMTVVAAPLNLGALDNLWAVQRGEARPFGAVLGWYADLRRAGRAAALQLLLQIVQALLQCVCALPGVAAFLALGGGVVGYTAGVWIMFAFQIFAWCLMTQFMPARYLLAKHSDRGVWAAFRDGWALLRGKRGNYLKFRLSFLLWELVNALTRGMMNLYLFPYQGLANMCWLEEAAKEN